MKRTGTSSGTLAPSVFIIIFIFFVISAVLTDYASARDRRSPVSGRGKESGARKTPPRRQETPRRDPAPSPPRRKDPAPSVDKRRDPAPSPPRRKDPPRTDPRKYPDGIHGSKTDDDRSFRRKDRRKIKKDPSPYDRFEKRMDLTTREKRDDGHSGGDIEPGIGPCIPPYVPPRPPWWPRPPCWRPPVICVTNIYYNTYIYQPVYIDGLIDDELYGITLPFGPILPWEVGEFYLIRLKNLEEKGYGGSMMVTLVQTMDEMGWEEFLGRFGNSITDVLYYGPIGRTSFLVGMTVSDILDIMVDDGIRWVGEFYPEYKIVPGGRNTKFYVRSLEGDSVGFRRELRDAGVFVMGFDPDTQEYFVRSSEDTYDMVAKLWWVARISGARGEPFFQPESEWMDVGMSP